MSTKESNRFDRVRTFCRETANKYHISYDRPTLHIWKDQIAIFGFAIGLLCVSMLFISTSNLLVAPMSNIQWLPLALLSVGGIVLCQKTINEGIRQRD